ncbi:ABC transporter ATP-binding protein [Actinoplanes friuliensis]|uniref:ABC transporter ATPase/permease n=1 Tax=Actinoplanes friuliensis DSM 7358 TaxID=1246995 RepID=U5WD29_9ACTN|nr:ABC transporter ATP-binding protein [Actinoplanes friuliensis]AGZ45851.1 ABC transporter ATPase/permease [Actinoplanes friuliensis DSM 7358]
MRDLWLGITGVLGSSWRASKGRLLISAFLMLLGNVSAPLIAVFLALATDATLERDTDLAVWAAVAVALVALLSLTMEHFAHIFFFELADLHHLSVEREIGDLAHGTAGLDQHERQDYADRMELLRKESWEIANGVQTVLTAITLSAQIVLTAVLLARVEPWLLLLPLFAVPPLIAGRFAEARLERAELKTAEPRRLGWHLLELAVSAAAAKEIRLFGLQRVLRERQAAARRAEEVPLRRAEVAGLGLRLIGQLIFAIGYVAAVVVVVRSAIGGERSVGDVVLVITLAVQTNAQAAGVVAVAGALQRNARALARVRWLRRETELAADPIVADQPVPSALHDGIRFDGVAFRYPGTETDVLRDVNVHIPAGATVAIVGDNGAGKSTLVKLLSRFYRPSAGEITVDGVDLRRISPDRWRERIAAGFQDFVKLEAPARESIGVGDLARSDDAEAVRAAVHRADAELVIERLPEGLESHLGKAYEDGEELSGGQWQRVALSRAMMRDEPLLLLLDEPTAALDPLTEHALFERYAASAREVGSRTGGITVLVSHRFSTVRMADLILVVADGGIAEAGTHQDLMARNGLYAELFTLQAAAYR